MTSGYRSMAARMLFTLLFIAAVIAAAVIVFEISRERDERISQQHNEAQAVVSADREPLSLALWSYNQREIETILRGLVRGSSIYQAQVVEGNSILLTVTRPGGTVLRPDLRWQLPLLRPGGKDVLGYLRLSENYDAEKQGLYRSAISLAIGEVAQISVIALTFFTLMYFGITRPLAQLAKKVESIASPESDVVNLDRPFHRGPDEIDSLVDVVNYTIKERQRLERVEKLRQERSASTAKLAALGQLAGGVAHDFNNILAIIAGFADLLTQDLPAESESRRFSQKITAATYRGRDLILQIMTFANTGGVVLSPTDLVKIVRQNEPLVSASVSKTTHVKFTYGVRSAFVAGAPVQLGQLLMNLVLNANDAVSGRAGTIEVHVGFARQADLPLAENPVIGQLSAERIVGTLEPNRDYACLSISDSGTGILPEVFDKIFDPFFTTKRRARGTGLGLAVVHGVMLAHKAACRVVTREGVGTTFFVYFPLVEAEERPSIETKRNVAGGTGGQRVLLVDDEEDVLEALTIGLARRGFKVRAFRDPIEALAAFEEGRDQFDVLVADQTMPGLEGNQLVQRIKALNPGLKAIICSGRDMEGVSRSVVDAVMAKPVNIDALANSIRSMAPVEE
jgi:signal transduction histidine kinase